MILLSTNLFLSYKYFSDFILLSGRIQSQSESVNGTFSGANNISSLLGIMLEYIHGT